MPTVYHASSTWIEEPQIALVKSGNGKPSHGLGVYVTESAQDAREMLGTRDGSGAVYKFDVEKPSGWIKITEPLDTAVQAHLLRTIQEVAPPYIAQKTADYASNSRGLPPPKAFKVLELLKHAFPDQRRQDEILLGAGVCALQIGDRTCVLDPKILPLRMQVHDLIDGGPTGMPDHIEVGSFTRGPRGPFASEASKTRPYKADELNSAVQGMEKLNNTTLTHSFELLSKTLLTAAMTGDDQPPGVSLSQVGYLARNGLGRAMDNLAYESQTGKAPDPYTGGMATLGRHGLDLQLSVGSAHPAVKAWEKLQRDLHVHVRSQAVFQTKIDQQPVGYVDAGQIFLGAEAAKGTVLHTALSLVATSRDSGAMVNTAWMLQNMRTQNTEGAVSQRQINDTIGQNLLDAIRDPSHTGAALAKKLDALRLPKAVEMRTCMEHIARQVVRAAPELSHTAQNIANQLRMSNSSKNSQTQKDPSR